MSVFAEPSIFREFYRKLEDGERHYDRGSDEGRR